MSLVIYPAGERGGGPPQDVVLTLVPEAGYRVGTPESHDNHHIESSGIDVGRESDGAMQLTWKSEPGKLYRIVFKDSLTDTDWTDLGNDIMATDSSTSWIDNTAAGFSRRFYRVRLAD